MAGSRGQRNETYTKRGIREQLSDSQPTPCPVSHKHNELHIKTYQRN